MKYLKLLAFMTLCLLCGGCLTARRTWEQISPFYAGKWRYSTRIYSGMDYDTLWDGLLQSADIGLNKWPFEELDKEGGRLKTYWVRSGDKRRRLEMRIDRVKGEEGECGYLISLRIPRQRTIEAYTPMRTKYTWRLDGQDELMEELIFIRIRDEFREYPPLAAAFGCSCTFCLA